MSYRVQNGNPRSCCFGHRSADSDYLRTTRAMLRLCQAQAPSPPCQPGSGAARARSRSSPAPPVAPSALGGHARPRPAPSAPQQPGDAPTAPWNSRKFLPENNNYPRTYLGPLYENKREEISYLFPLLPSLFCIFTDDSVGWMRDFSLEVKSCP